MNAHDRFESLAGAIALGEATPQERSAFDAHALNCARCRDDVDAGAFVIARVAEAHRSETWRPSQPIVERIRARRTHRTRFTLGALGWAVGASLVVNVALAGGLGSRLAGTFRAEPAPPALVAASSVSLDAPHLRIVAPQTWHRPRVTRGNAAANNRMAQAARERIAVAPRPAPPKEPKVPTLGDVPDILAGLDLYGTGAAHHRVALETLPRCKAAAGDEGAEVAIPCRDATGHIVR